MLMTRRLLRWPLLYLLTLLRLSQMFLLRLPMRLPPFPTLPPQWLTHLHHRHWKPPTFLTSSRRFRMLRLHSLLQWRFPLPDLLMSAPIQMPALRRWHSAMPPMPGGQLLPPSLQNVAAPSGERRLPSWPPENHSGCPALNHRRP
ncbi:hypothetical protein GEM23_03790 [Salmonella enterica]|nr:hypothetical protein [Salmonella enterica]